MTEKPQTTENKFSHLTFTGSCPTCGQRFLMEENEKLRWALEEIAQQELDEGDDVEDEPSFGARYYINLAREALK